MKGQVGDVSDCGSMPCAAEMGLGLLGSVLFFLTFVSPAWATSTAAASQTSANEIAAAVFGGGNSPAQLRVQASGGYSVQVAGSGRRVTLTASGPAGTVIYSVPGTASTRGIKANFGRRGRVDVRFRPSRRMRIETAPNRCKGKPRVTRWGVFVGTIRFAGERGYTRVRRSRAPGRTRVSPRWKCKRRRGGSGKFDLEGIPGLPGGSGEDAVGSGEDAVILEISNRPTGVEAAAIDFAPAQDSELVFLLAGVEERRKRMRISRFALEFARADVFSFDDSLATATVGPAGPFLGTATFQRSSRGLMTGSGSLAIALPGMARTPLVGAGNRVRLYRLSEDGIANPGV